MKRQKLIVGNWKMYKNLTTAVQDFNELVTLISQKQTTVDIGIAAPSIFLSDLSRYTSKSVSLYAQNAHWENEGAFTGEVSPAVLKDMHVAGSLVAHSERRQMFGETNQTAGKRMGALLRKGLKAILCVGETLQEREAGKLSEILSEQIKTALNYSGLRNASEFIGSNPFSPLFSVAYEPVWAIGTGKAATPKEAQEAHKMIRKELANYFNSDFANKIQILYGGSVKPNNILDFINCEDVDGALVGGASLIPSDFAAMCIY